MDRDSHLQLDQELAQENQINLLPREKQQIEQLQIQELLQGTHERKPRDDVDLITAESPLLCVFPGDHNLGQTGGFKSNTRHDAQNGPPDQERAEKKAPEHGGGREEEEEQLLDQLREQQECQHELLKKLFRLKKKSLRKEEWQRHDAKHPNDQTQQESRQTEQPDLDDCDHRNVSGWHEKYKPLMQPQQQELHHHQAQQQQEQQRPQRLQQPRQQHHRHKQHQQRLNGARRRESPKPSPGYVEARGPTSCIESRLVSSSRINRHGAQEHSEHDVIQQNLTYPQQRLRQRLPRNAGKEIPEKRKLQRSGDVKMSPVVSKPVKPKQSQSQSEREQESQQCAEHKEINDDQQIQEEEEEQQQNIQQPQQPQKQQQQQQHHHHQNQQQQAQTGDDPPLNKEIERQQFPRSHGQPEKQILDESEATFSQERSTSKDVSIVEFYQEWSTQQKVAVGQEEQMFLSWNTQETHFAQSKQRQGKEHSRKQMFARKKEGQHVTSSRTPRSLVKSSTGAGNVRGQQKKTHEQVHEAKHQQRHARRERQRSQPSACPPQTQVHEICKESEKSRRRPRHRSLDPSLQNSPHRSRSTQPRLFVSDMWFARSFENENEERDKLDLIAQQMEKCYQRHSERHFQNQHQRLQHLPHQQEARHQPQQKGMWQQQQQHQLEFLQIKQRQPEKASSYPGLSEAALPSKRLGSETNYSVSDSVFSPPFSALTDTRPVESDHQKHNLPVGCAWHPPPLPRRKTASSSPTISSKARSKSSVRTCSANEGAPPVYSSIRNTARAMKRAKTTLPTLKPPMLQSKRGHTSRAEAGTSRPQCSQKGTLRMTLGANPRREDVASTSPRDVPPGTVVGMPTQAPMRRPRTVSATARHTRASANRGREKPASPVVCQIASQNQRQQPPQAAMQDHKRSRIPGDKNTGKVPPESPPKGTQHRWKKSHGRSNFNTKQVSERARSLSAGHAASNMADVSVERSPEGHRKPRKANSTGERGRSRRPCLNQPTLKHERKELSSRPPAKSPDKLKRGRRRDAKPDGVPAGVTAVSRLLNSAPASSARDTADSSYPPDFFGSWGVAPHDYVISQASENLQGLADAAHRTGHFCRMGVECRWDLGPPGSYASDLMRRAAEICPQFGHAWLSDKSKDDGIVGRYDMSYSLGSPRWRERSASVLESASLPIVDVSRAEIISKFKGEIDVFKCAPELPTCPSDSEGFSTVEDNFLKTSEAPVSPTHKGLVSRKQKTLQSVFVSPQDAHSLPSLGLGAGLWMKSSLSAGREKSTTSGPSLETEPHVKRRRSLNSPKCRPNRVEATDSAPTAHHSKDTVPSQYPAAQRTSLKAPSASAESWIKRREALPPKLSISSHTLLSARDSLTSGNPSYPHSRKAESIEETDLRGQGTGSEKEAEGVSDRPLLARRGSIVLSLTPTLDRDADPPCSPTRDHHHRRSSSSPRRRRRQALQASTLVATGAAPSGSSLGHHRGRTVLGVCLGVLLLFWLYFTGVFVMALP